VSNPAVRTLASGDLPRDRITQCLVSRDANDQPDDKARSRRSAKRGQDDGVDLAPPSGVGPDVRKGRPNGRPSYFGLSPVGRGSALELRVGLRTQTASGRSDMLAIAVCAVTSVAEIPRSGACRGRRGASPAGDARRPPGSSVRAARPRRSRAPVPLRRGPARGSWQGRQAAAGATCAASSGERSQASARCRCRSWRAGVFSRERGRAGRDRIRGRVVSL